MNNPYNSFRRIIALLSVCLFMIPLFGAVESFYNIEFGNQISTGSSMSVSDAQWNVMSSSSPASWDFANKSARGEVIFSMDLDQYQGTAYEAEIDLEITYFDENGGSTTVFRSLQIDYTPQGRKTFTAKRYTTFQGAHHMLVDVLDLRIDGASVGTVPDYLQLETRIEVERYYKFSRSLNINTPTATVSGGTITFQWNAASAHLITEYDLEWTFVDDYDDAVSGLSYLSASALTYNFEEQATRVTVSEMSYEISNVFDHGYLVYRIRPVGYVIEDPLQRQEGRWNLTNSSGSVSSAGSKLWISSPHHPEKNWQFVANYAEEGKKGEAVSYRDATMRTRQSVTRNSSEDFAIAKEDIYDYQGRPAITILPTPMGSDQITYYPNLNQDDSGGEFNWEDFDKDSPGGTGCNGLTGPQMSTASGASQYYSPNNPDQEAQQAYVPDAKKYPYAQTEYTPDNTGRVRRAGGVGPTHQIGQKDTRYVYGDPLQEELNRLFGTEVGYANRYKKHAVVDPNGSVSVSYLDAKGNVIATALGGDAPPNLDALPSSGNPILIEADLTARNEYSAMDNGYVIRMKRAVTTPGNYSFEYAIQQWRWGLYWDSCIPEACYDCVYDIYFSVLDECGQEMLPGGTIDTTVTPLSELDDICSGVPTFNLRHITAYLGVGEYTIIKKLTVNQTAIDQYLQFYLDPDNNTCIKTLHEFQQAALDTVDYSGCDKDVCTVSCEMEIGTLQEYLFENPGATQLDYQNELNSCLEECENSSYCVALEGLLRADVTPGGQYASWVVNGNGDTVSTDPCSILNPNSTGINYTDGTYTNFDGTPFPPIFLDGNLYTSPAQLPLNAFLHFWEANPTSTVTWIDTLITLHPQYCKLKWCRDNASSHTFDANLLDINSLDEAQAAGFIIPNSSLTPSSPINILDNDPFFSGNASLKSDMTDALQDYININGTWYNIWEYTLILVHCAKDTNLSQTDFYNCINSLNFSALGVCSQDEEWWIYRSLYLSKKGELVEKEEYVCGPCGNGTDYDLDLEAELGINFNQPPNQLSSWAISSIESHCDSICIGYATNWWNEISHCASISDSARVVDSLIYICTNGCDTSRPMGASSLPPNHPATGYTTFQEVLNGELGLPIDPGVNPICNAQLISWPPPYASNGTDPMSEVNPLDTCACSIMLEAQAEYDNLLLANNLPSGVNSLMDYFEHLYGVQLPWLGSAVCACEEVFEDITGQPWATGLSWPNDANADLEATGIYVVGAEISCPSNCVSCQEVQNRLAFYSYLETYSNGDDLIAQMLNQEFDFNLSYWDYVDFADYCDDGSGGNCSVNRDPGSLDEILFYLTTNNLWGQSSQDLSPLMPNDWFADGGSCAPTYSLVSESNDGYGGGPAEIVFQLADGCCTDCTIRLEEVLCDECDNWNLNNTSPGENFYSMNPSPFGTNADFLIGISFGGGYFQFYGYITCSSQPKDLCNASPFITGLPQKPPCAEMLESMAIGQATEAYEAYMDSVSDTFRERYIERCLLSTGGFYTLQESLTMSFEQDEYHYMLYYYDQAGSLIKTVPPKGVNFLPVADWATVDDIRDNGATTVLVPSHELETQYRYNSLNQLMWQYSPDGGETEMWYDRLGRLIASQDARQAALDLYSYVLFDELGRVKEGGEIDPSSPMTDAIALNDASFQNWINAGTRYERVITHYDAYPSSGILSRFDTEIPHLRNRVAGSEYIDVRDSHRDYNTYYAYDELGNVSEVLTEFPDLAHLGQDFKHTRYYYDLVSGNTNEVHYQVGEPDQFFYRYVYDADNRLVDTYSGRDSTVLFAWEERDARYQYYKHGPLARVELGEERVQGVDYAYSLQGWMVGVNSDTRVATRDMGKDGTDGLSGIPYTSADPDIHEYFARDAFGFSLGYYQDIYAPINGSIAGQNHFLAQNRETPDHRNLYNGNISNMVTALGDTLGGSGYAIQEAQYHYDQLNRLTQMRAFRDVNLVSTNQWSHGATDDYSVDLTYDAVGNIESLIRNGSSTAGPLEMDELSYNYYSGTNRLGHVEDAVAVGNYGLDVDGQSDGNYVYDPSGNLIQDDAGNLDRIGWSSRGKIREIEKAAEAGPWLSFHYDPTGQRIVKVVKEADEQGVKTEDTWRYTYYVRDAGGNTLATYERYYVAQDEALDAYNNQEPFPLPVDPGYMLQLFDYAPYVEVFRTQEYHLYGSQRLGIQQDSTWLSVVAFDGLGFDSEKGYFLGKEVIEEFDPPVPSGEPVMGTPFTRADKQYELSNHLGNVLAVVSDRKLQVQGGSSAKGYDFESDIWQVHDYYPFGMVMPGRDFSAQGYRFGFGSHEKLDEIAGSGNYYDMGARLYDPRIGRTPTLDPAKQLYPGISPYAYAMNTPLQAIDPDGKVVIFINGLWGPVGGVNEPNEGYWGWNGDWVQGLKNHWKDKKALFFDGAVGGQSNLINTTSSTYRWVAGQKAGYSNAKSIIDNLSAGETIKFVTNSMGAAFQRGFSEGIQLYVNELQLGNLQAQQGVMSNVKAIQNQLDNFGSSPLLPGQTYEGLQQSLEAQKRKLSQLQTEYQKLENITTEIVVDIDPQNATQRDKNAQNHYYIMSDRSDYNWFERNFLDIQPVEGATDASTKSDGTPVTTGHHSTFTNPNDLPKPKK